MKRIAVLLSALCLIFTLFGCGGSAKTEQANQAREEYLKTVNYLNFELTGSETPYFMGRWFEKEIDGVPHQVTTTNGSLCYLLVENATNLTVDFTNISGITPYYAYSIDGNTPQRREITVSKIPIPDAGMHTVRIIVDGMTSSDRKWPHEVGYALKSITPSEGGHIFGIRPKNPVIFFYGDSMTEGINAVSNENNSASNSATNAYPWFCSEELGAVPYYVGYASSGLLTEGSFAPMISAIDYLSQNRKVDDTIQPDLIVINHGVNDGGNTDEAFKAALSEVMDRLQEKYPGVPIVYALPFFSHFKYPVAEIVTQYENTHIIQSNTWGLSRMDGTHFDVKGAQKAGKALAQELRSIMGADFFK